jgi:hypothetical protein
VKKLKHEAELFKGALLAGVKYAEGRKAVEFEPTDSESEKQDIWRSCNSDHQVHLIRPESVSMSFSEGLTALGFLPGSSQFFVLHFQPPDSCSLQ